MKKRIISLILTAIMLVGLIPLGALTVFADSDDQITYSGDVVMSEIDGDILLKYTGNGTLTLPADSTAWILLVGGGGAGGTVRSSSFTSHPGGGGGGAGEFLELKGATLTKGSYTIEVGAGGAPDGSSSTAKPGKNGEPSFIKLGDTKIYEALGGGGGGGESVGSDGGSGGGGSKDGGLGGAGVASDENGKVNAGGTSAKRYAGGGGGAGGAGESNPEGHGGAGGDGLASSITGSEVYYAAGGGGGITYSGKTGGAGGNGGGGNGGAYADSDTANATAGADNTGSGGGGGGRYRPGMPGGSGVVIIRLAKPAPAHTHDILICPKCGEQVSDLSRVDCPNCGEALEAGKLTFEPIATTEELLALFKNGGNGVLTDDIWLESTLTAWENPINLCLDGHSIIMNESYDIISVPNGATLTLWDCDTTAWEIFDIHGTGGCITSYSSSFTKRGITVGGTLVMNGGTVFNTRAGIYVSGGNVTMNGGAIAGNYDRGEESDLRGAGVFMDGGTFLMNGGSINNNTLRCNGDFSALGAGVFIDNAGSFTMNAGSIYKNVVGLKDSSGGGVCVKNGSFVQSGGDIYENEGSNGGGVYVGAGGSALLAGGKIRDNYAERFGGGIYDAGSLTVGGTVKVFGNSKESEGETVADNLFVEYGTKISVDSPAAGMLVGVSMDLGAWFTDETASSEDAIYFFADDEEKFVDCGYGLQLEDVADREAYKLSVAFSEHGVIYPDCQIVQKEVAGRTTVAVTVVPEEGYCLRSLVYNDGTDHDITNTRSFTMPDSDVTVKAVFERCAAYTGVSVTLSSDIYLNFYMTLADDAAKNGEMAFAIGDRTVGKAALRQNENGIYFACPLSALEMAQTVTATFTYDGHDYEYKNSVTEYLDVIINGKDQSGNPYSGEMKTLAVKLSNYGHYVQSYLASIHDSVKIGDGGFAEIGKFADADIAPASVGETLKNNFAAPEATDNFAFYGRTVYFDSATALNYYVTVKNGSINDVRCTGGKTTEVNHYKDNIYIVTIRDITAVELGENFALTIGGEFTITGSVLDYCGAVFHSHYGDEMSEKDACAVNAMAAFYEYYTAATVYADSLK